jgi:hypothetical protein
MAVREHKWHCCEHVYVAGLLHEGQERVREQSMRRQFTQALDTTDSTLHTCALHTYTRVVFRRGSHQKEMVLGVPAGSLASHAMLDENFEEPTHAELCQAHIRAAVLAVHPCRGEWVRDGQGRSWVLAADEYLWNDLLYNSIFSQRLSGGYTWIYILYIYIYIHIHTHT